MDGTIRDDQIRFAVTRDERLAWQLFLQKHGLNGSALLRRAKDKIMSEWQAENTDTAA